MKSWAVPRWKKLILERSWPACEKHNNDRSKSSNQASHYLQDMRCCVAFVEDDQRVQLCHGPGLAFSLKQVVLVKTHEDKEINAFIINTTIFTMNIKIVESYIS